MGPGEPTGSGSGRGARGRRQSSPAEARCEACPISGTSRPRLLHPRIRIGCGGAELPSFHPTSTVSFGVPPPSLCAGPAEQTLERKRKFRSHAFRDVAGIMDQSLSSSAKGHTRNKSATKCEDTKLPRLFVAMLQYEWEESRRRVRAWSRPRGPVLTFRDSISPSFIDQGSLGCG